jgi:hypothetical protein
MSGRPPAVGLGRFVDQVLPAYHRVLMPRLLEIPKNVTIVSVQCCKNPENSNFTREYSREFLGIYIIVSVVYVR